MTALGEAMFRAVAASLSVEEGERLPALLLARVVMVCERVAAERLPAESGR